MRIWGEVFGQSLDIWQGRRGEKRAYAVMSAWSIGSVKWPSRYHWPLDFWCR